MMPKEKRSAPSKTQTTVVGFGHGTQKSNIASIVKLARFCRHPDREEKFDLVKPLIAESLKLAWFLYVHCLPVLLVTFPFYGEVCHI